MAGYLSFIVITIIIHLLSLFFKFSFSEWDRIVAATTISTYFFSFANCANTIMTQSKNRYEEYDMMISRATDYSFFAARYESIITADLNEEIQKRTKTVIDGLAHLSKNDKKLYKNSKFWYQILSTIGFISFMLSLSISVVAQTLNSSLGLYSMLAFFVMFFSDYLAVMVDKEHNKSKEAVNDILSEIVTTEKFVFDFNLNLKLKELDKTTLEAENGQDEDAE